MPDHTELLNRASAAPTRTRAVRAPLEQAQHLLGPAQVIASPETRLRYRIGRLLGKGGYGQVYLARRLGRSTVVPSSLRLDLEES